MYNGMRFDLIMSRVDFTVQVVKLKMFAFSRQQFFANNFLGPDYTVLIFHFFASFFFVFSFFVFQTKKKTKRKSEKSVPCS